MSERIIRQDELSEEVEITTPGFASMRIIRPRKTFSLREVLEITERMENKPKQDYPRIIE